MHTATLAGACGPKKNLHYSQNVRVGDQIHCSGQGCWQTHIAPPPDCKKTFPTSVSDEINQALANVEVNLKDADGKGFSLVYKIIMYSTDVPSQHKYIGRNLRKWFPSSPPIWTEVKTKELGAKEMRFEIEVEAYNPWSRCWRGGHSYSLYRLLKFTSSLSASSLFVFWAVILTGH